MVWRKTSPLARQLLQISEVVCLSAGKARPHRQAVRSQRALRPRMSQSDVIRPARADEYDEIGRVWMESWVSTGLAEASNFLLANLRARIRREIANGWSLFVADDQRHDRRDAGAASAKALSRHAVRRARLSGQIARPAICSPSRARKCRMKCTCAACARTKKPGAGTSAKALCSRRKRLEPSNGFMMKYYRWKNIFYFFFFFLFSFLLFFPGNAAMIKLYWSPSLALVHDALADGRERPAL